MTSRRIRTRLVAGGAVVALLAVGLMGCTQYKVSSIVDKSELSDASSLRTLSPSEQVQLKDVLVGEIQSVEGGDSDLARVFGQVANFGKTPYAEVEFEIVAQQQNSEGTTSENKPIARFFVKNLSPRVIQPFDT